MSLALTSFINDWDEGFGRGLKLQEALLELRWGFVAWPYGGDNYPVDFVGMWNGMEDGKPLEQDTQ